MRGEEGSLQRISEGVGGGQGGVVIQSKTLSPKIKYHEQGEWGGGGVSIQRISDERGSLSKEYRRSGMGVHTKQNVLLLVEAMCFL